MASDLLAIARSGARTARGALEVTAQNIANAASEGYVRRSVTVEEVAASGGLLRQGDISLSGSRITGLARNADAFRQAEVRRTDAEAARGSAELQGLENIEAAIEQSRVYPLTVEFEAALRGLRADPVDPSLRAATLAAARNMAAGFTIAARSLDAAGEGLQFEALAQVEEANGFAAELARINLRMARAGEGSSDKASLLDARDLMLERLSARVGIAASFSPEGMVEVRVGGPAGPVLVAGGSAAAIGASIGAGGTLGFAVAGTGFDPQSGSIAGKAAALEAVALRRTQLDAAASAIVATVNGAQGNGAALDGSPGQPLLTGTGAASIALLPVGAGAIATAPAGSPAGSIDGGNLEALSAAFAAAGHAGALSAILFEASAEVAGKKVTGEALDAIAGAARVALDQQSGVDLDQEAANLVRFQQAFQASGRAMQVASDIFDTLLGIGR